MSTYSAPFPQPTNPPPWPVGPSDWRWVWPFPDNDATTLTVSACTHCETKDERIEELEQQVADLTNAVRAMAELLLQQAKK